jgi:tRNA(adenine34) deaminase
MKDLWTLVGPTWQSCLEEAWAAYCAGSLPIGAVVIDQSDVILSRGRNRWYESETNNKQICGTRLAHAELNALIQLPQDRSDYHDWSLYTTLEPCPFCMGALYMTGIRNLHFAARDPWAGSTNILGTTPYLSRKAIQIYPPQQPVLESILIGLGTVAILQDRISRVEEVLESKRSYHPEGVKFGERLYSNGALDYMRENHIKAPTVYNNLANLWQKQE